MAEGDGLLMNSFKAEVMKGTFNLATGGDTIKVALLTAHTVDIDLHTVWADISANEVSGTGYTAGGMALTGQDVTQDNTNDRGVFDAADVTWTGLSAGTPSHAAMYDDTPVSPVDPLIAVWEVTTPTNGGDYTLQWGAAGIVLLSTPA